MAKQIRKMKKINVLILLFLSMAISSTAQNFDINVLKQTNGNRNKNLDGFFCTWGKVSPYVSVATPLALYSVGIAKHDKRLQKMGIEQAVGITISSGITYIIKHAVNRPRPGVTYPTLTPLEPLTNYSFPSGHTSSAFYTATATSLQFKKWYVTAPAFLLAGITAYSRMHEGVHYPTDVMAGATLGVMSAYATNMLNKYLQQSKKTKNYYNKLLW
jgi:membrane-associated phospholipid phosphatase